MDELKIQVKADITGIEKLIDQLKGLQTYKMYEGADQTLVDLDDVVKIFADHVEAEVAQPQWRCEWIPCSERLPDEEKRSYWVCTDSGYQYECRWTNNVFGFHESDNWGWSVFDTPPYSKVIAWMPLPKPYKAERKEE